ncbi:PREDICTED: UDP-glycosyltransferase 71D2 [Tarenaya hassleriana]|uniref:UDP-glycosyltransferase 71D2 n=1 Tax=Tarenaya hassleriana TaxID=28532 RepID=UPI00053C665C|nr:PREDICTED: UDP-glycosyltransferase 71D2 [Tarenaya hassleriana]XP_019056529.1 PREDICTED: UDP-glycosyltransferase 71D2 [Tarenaya hassleriana]XP_019056530.1 PREDICTED: UDP-glycosyltransferase 71D2 [Tarenaya hassleriana]XP_019056531.1 PREDICTED: UDP-glycosyltransferase 71D2 [Tarenaya hassleriana]
MRSAELIFIPTPLVSHLVSILEFARRLIDQDDRIRITILLMKLQGQAPLDPYARSFASSLPCVQLIDVPELEEEPGLVTQSVEAHMYAVIEKNIPLVRNIIMDILSSRPSDGIQVKGLVLDFFCLPMIGIASEVSLPPYVFLSANAGFLTLMQYLPERNRKDTSVFERNSEEWLPIQGFANPVPLKVLPSGLFWQDGYDVSVKLGELFAKAEGVLVNTSIDIEPSPMNHFLHDPGYPSVYAIGPILDLKAHPHPDLDLVRRAEVIEWLDRQPEASVVFLCFGSLGRLSSPLVKEIAQGLEKCGHRFLWSFRTQQPTNGDPDSLLPEGFLDSVSGRGMICGWAPQVEILAHKAIGGFVSHCGWTSILESLWFGVPIVTWPMYAEQQLNAFMMVKELGLAVELRLDYRVRSGEIVMANELETAIRCLMEKSNVVREKVKEISALARKAVMNGGSSSVAIEKFIQDVVGSRS